MYTNTIYPAGFQELQRFRGLKGLGTTKNAGAFKLCWQLAFMHVKLTKKHKLKNLFNFVRNSSFAGLRSRWFEKI